MKSPTTTMIQNPRKIEAPEPPAYPGKTEKISDPSETVIDSILRRLAALEKAQSGRVKE